MSILPDEQENQAIADYLKLLDEGVSVNREEFLARHPEDATQLRHFFADLDIANTSLAHTAPLRRKRVGQGEQLGHFMIEECLGAGAFGTVWKASDLRLERSVALKVPNLGLLQGVALPQFLREARASAALQHPSIVRVHEVGEHEGVVFIVSDFIEGSTLLEWIQSAEIRPRECAKLAKLIAGALDYAHSQGVIHRDIKPSNILMSLEGEPLVADFGLAKRLTGEDTITLEGQVLGTASYMSPEQAMGEGHAADARSDVYSLGAVLYHMLTGEKPFAGRADAVLQQVIHDQPQRPSKLNPGVPRDLETICLKCMEKSRDSRYPSAAHVVDELGRFLKGTPIHARPLNTMQRTYRWCLANPLLSTTVVLLALLAVGGPLVAVHQRRLSNELRSTVQARDVALIAESEARQEAEAALAREELSLRQAQRTADFLATTFTAPQPEVSGPDVTLLQALEAMPARIEAELKDEPLVAARIASQVGWTFLRLNQHPKAVLSLEKAESLYRAELGENHPLTIKNAKGLAWAYTYNQAASKAVEFYEQLGSKHPQLLEEFTSHETILRAEAYMFSEKAADAIPILQDLLEREPDNQYASMRLVEAMQWSGRGEEIQSVLQDFQKHRKGLPETFGSLSHQGMLLLRMNKPDKALTMYEQSLVLHREEEGEELSPEAMEDRIWTCDAIANIYQQRGHLEDALPLRLEAVRLASSLWGEGNSTENLSRALGYLYAISGRTSVDASDLVGLPDEMKQDILGVVSENRGVHAFKAGKLTEAADAFAYAAPRMQDGSPIYTYALCSQLLTSNREKYDELFQSMLARYGKDERSDVIQRICKLYCLVPREDMPEFLRLERLVEAHRSEDNVWHGFTLALVKYRQGEAETALRMCEELLEQEIAQDLAASSQVLSSLALTSLGESEASGVMLQKASTSIEPMLRTADKNWLRGWCFAEVLRREAAKSLSTK